MKIGLQYDFLGGKTTFEELVGLVKVKHVLWVHFDSQKMSLKVKICPKNEAILLILLNLLRSDPNYERERRIYPFPGFFYKCNGWRDIFRVDSDQHESDSFRVKQKEKRFYLIEERFKVKIFHYTDNFYFLRIISYGSPLQWFQFHQFSYFPVIKTWKSGI